MLPTGEMIPVFGNQLGALVCRDDRVAAMIPVLLAVGIGIPGVDAGKLALTMALTTGIMGVITPYATGPGLAYYESGYLPSGDFWKLGTIFGLIFLAALMMLGFPLIMSR